jgi:DNA-binding IclR family transcriptional regulator
LLAFDHEEIDEGTSAVATPIFNHEENPVAALVVAAPTQRITSSRDSSLVSELKTAAAKISAQLYCDRE